MFETLAGRMPGALRHGDARLIEERPPLGDGKRENAELHECRGAVGPLGIPCLVKPAYPANLRLFSWGVEFARFREDIRC